MREMNFLGDFKVIRFTYCQRGGSPFAHAIHGQDCGLFKWGWEERACGVAQVMFGEKQTPVPINLLRRVLFQLIAKQGLLKELLAQPKRNSHLERSKTFGRKGDIG